MRSRTFHRFLPCLLALALLAAVLWNGTTVIDVTDSTYAASAIALDVSNQPIDYDDIVVTSLGEAPSDDNDNGPGGRDGLADADLAGRPERLEIQRDHLERQHAELHRDRRRLIERPARPDPRGHLRRDPREPHGERQPGDLHHRDHQGDQLRGFPASTGTWVATYVP